MPQKQSRRAVQKKRVIGDEEVIYHIWRFSSFHTAATALTTYRTWKIIYKILHCAISLRWIQNIKQQYWYHYRLEEIKEHEFKTPEKECNQTQACTPQINKLKCSRGSQCGEITVNTAVFGHTSNSVFHRKPRYKSEVMRYHKSNINQINKSHTQTKYSIIRQSHSSL